MITSNKTCWLAFLIYLRYSCVMSYDDSLLGTVVVRRTFSKDEIEIYEPGL